MCAMLRRTHPPDPPSVLPDSPRVVTPDEVGYIQQLLAQHREWTR